MELKQFDFNLDRFHYTIEETGIRLIKRSIASGSDTFVEFEDIGSKIIKENTRKLIWIILSVAFLLLASAVFIKRMSGGRVGNGAELFHLTLALIFLLLFQLTKKNSLFLAQSDNTNAIEFIGAKRYKENVEHFIKELLQKRDEFLLDKYSKIDEFLPYNQQYNNLVWLYNLTLLTKEQLKNKIQELDNQTENANEDKKTGLTRIVGFKRNSFDEDLEEDISDE